MTKIVEHRTGAGEVSMTINHQGVEYLWVESEKKSLKELADDVGRSYRHLLAMRKAGLLVIDGFSTARCVRTFQIETSGSAL